MMSNEMNEAPHYPLTPTQQGMLFNSLYAPGSGVEIEQVVCSLRERLKVPAFERAWQRVVERHEALRVGFRWEGLTEPYQQVEPRVNLSWAAHDLRRIPEAEQERRLADYLTADRRRGFDLRVASPMRFTLFRLAEDDYRFICTVHHALCDLRSFIICLREAFAFYEAFARGEELELPRPGSYWDYVAWLAEQQHETPASQQFWQTALERFDAPTPLPQGFPASTGRTDEGGFREQSVRLSLEATGRLKAIAGENRMTLNNFILGAWSLLLSRYSGEDEVVFGTTRTCRYWGEGEGNDAAPTVGLYINTLPFRARITPDKSLIEWLGGLRAEWLAARQHVHTPFALIQEWSEVRRGTPLFESILVHAHEELNTTLRSQGGNWERRSFHIVNQTGFPLTLGSYGEAELKLKLRYDPRRFDDDTCARLLKHLEIMLRGMSENPSQRISDLPFFTSEELRRQLVEWNDTAFAYPSEKCLHELFEEQAARTPERISVRFGLERLTYAELDARADELARRLRTRGVGPESTVGVLLARSVELVVALLGVLKAGAAYVPLDPEYPSERLRAMIEDARPAFVLTGGETVGLAAACGAEELRLGSTGDVSPGEGANVSAANVDATRQHEAASAHNAAYVIYTSGSTGNPKGVVVTHRALVNHMSWMQRVFPLSADDRVLQKTPASFDASVWEFWAPLLCGAELIVARPGGHRDASYLTRLMADEGVTVVQCVPTLLRVLSEEEGLKECRRLRRVFCGGEALAAETAEAVAQITGAEVVNLYGPTEATIDATARVYDSGEEYPAGYVPLGRPIANTQVYILDKGLRPVPAGVPGELYIGGDGLARGYLGRPELTAERFVPDPFSVNGGTRLYRTGDRARFLRDGQIEFLGRLDYQVKVRGHRIELGEVEAALGAHAAVREAVVSVYQNPQGERRLVAYVVTDNVAAPAELRASLEQVLPQYMVPSQFIVLDALPLAPNGKVDRKRLPEPTQMQVETADTYVAPATPVEQIIAETWREVLKVERVGSQDNFFELGGHSLLATRVISRINQICHVDLTLRSLFEWPTLSALSTGVEAAKVAGESARIPALSRAPRKGRGIKSARQSIPAIPRKRSSEGTEECPQGSSR
ncbi:MAG TPA: amino acid adenylation domain-containing protein [Pyrinomonadaceae bacterium]